MLVVNTKTRQGEHTPNPNRVYRNTIRRAQVPRNPNPCREYDIPDKETDTVLPPIRARARSATIRGHRRVLAIREERGTRPRACAAVELREDDRRARAAGQPHPGKRRPRARRVFLTDSERPSLECFERMYSGCTSTAEFFDAPPPGCESARVRIGIRRRELQPAPIRLSV